MLQAVTGYPGMSWRRSARGDIFLNQDGLACRDMEPVSGEEQEKGPGDTPCHVRQRVPTALLWPADLWSVML